MNTSRIQKAKQLLTSVRGKPNSDEERSLQAIELSALMFEEALAIQTREEKQIQSQIARMMQDPKGKIFTTSMTDQCFRSENTARVADQMSYLLQKYGVPQFLSLSKRLAFSILKGLGKPLHALFVPLTKEALRKETAHVILPGEPKE